MNSMRCKYYGTDALSLANDIGVFFIHTKLEDNKLSHSIVDYSILCSVEISFMEFNNLSMDNVRELISCLAKKTTSLDPMPTSLVL